MSTLVARDGERWRYWVDVAPTTADGRRVKRIEASGAGVPPTHADRSVDASPVDLAVVFSSALDAPPAALLVRFDDGGTWSTTLAHP